MTTSQRRVDNLIVDTLTQMKARTGFDGALCHCIETKTIYKYLEAGGSYTANDTTIAITGDGGNTRWFGVAGRYGISMQHVVTVSPSGDMDFTSIKDAVDSITVGAGEHYLVHVGPGTYIEDPITGKEGVDIISMTGPLQTVIVLSSHGGDLITFAGTGTFKGFTLAGAASSSLMVMAAAGKTQLIDDIMVSSSLTGLEVSNGYVLLNTMNAVGAMGTFISFTGSGTGTLKSIGTAAGVTVGTGLSVVGVNTQCTVHGARFSATCTTGINIDSAEVNIVDTTILNCTYGIVLDGACNVSVDTIHMDDTTTIHANVLSASVVLKIAGGEVDRNRILPAAGFQGETAQFIDSSDGLMLMWSNVSIGRPMNPKELSVGDGVEYSSGMTVYTTDNTATSTTDGGNLTDVTAAAQSPTGSTFTFQGVGANHTILMGSIFGTTTDMLKLSSIVMHQAAAAVEAVAGNKSFTFEIWDGTNWIETHSFAVSSNELYRYANSVFLRADSDENIFFTPWPTWTKKTIDSKNLYWLRVRINTAVTTLPTFQQMHLQHNFSRFTIKGQQYYVGEGKFKASLAGGGNIFGESGGVGSAGYTVGSGALPASWIHEVKNCVMNGSGDAVYFQGAIPRGFCTACPVQVRVTLYAIGSKTAAASDASFIVSFLPIEKSGVMVADTGGAIAPVARTLANTEQVTANAGQYSTHAVPANDVAYNKFQLLESDYFTMSDYYEGDIINIRIEMDDDGDENQDYAVWAVEVVGAKWTHGERI